VAPPVQVVGLSQAWQGNFLSPSSASSLFGDSDAAAASPASLLLQGLLLPSLLQGGPHSPTHSSVQAPFLGY